MVSRAKFTHIADAAIAWAKHHPTAPQSPRLLARVIMAASVRADDGSQLMVAARRLLTDFPQSIEARYSLAATPTAKAYRLLVSKMLYWYGSRPDLRRATAVDHLLRVGLRRFALPGIYKGQFVDAMLCFLAARQADDAAVADEMLGCTEPSPADKKNMSVTAADEIRELVTSRNMTASQKLADLSVLGRRSASVVLLEHYYLHRMSPALRRSPRCLRIRAQVLVSRDNFRRALVVLAHAQAKSHNAKAELMQVYCNAVLDRAGPAAAAAMQLRRDFPQSRWLTEACELAKLAAAEPVADRQLTRFLLARLQWAGRKLTGMQIHATLKPTSGTPWKGYWGVSDGHLAVQVWHKGSVDAALASNHGTSRIFDPRRKKTFVLPPATTGEMPAASPNPVASPPAEVSDLLATLGSRELSARGLVNEYVPARLKTYLGVQELFKLLHYKGGFVVPPARNGTAITYAIVFAGIDKPGLWRITAKVRRGGSTISIRCAHWAALRVTTSSSSHFHISPPPWPAGPVVRVKNPADENMEVLKVLLQGWLPAGMKALESLASRRLPGLAVQIPALTPHCYVRDKQWNAPPFTGSPRHALPAKFRTAARRRAAAALAWAKDHRNSGTVPAKLFHAIMLAKLAHHPKLRGRIERWLILHDGASLQGRYDLQRFSTPKEFGRLVQAMLDANAVRMTRRRAVGVMRVLYYGVERFNHDKTFIDLFGTGNHVAAAFCAGVASQAGWTKVAAELNALVAELAHSDKTLATVRHALSQPDLTNGQRIQALAEVDKSRQAPFLAAYLLAQMGHLARENPGTERAAALIYLQTNHLRRALACTQELQEKGATAQAEFIRADCQMRLGHTRAARKTTLHALKSFPHSRWRKELQLLAEVCMSNQENRRLYAATLLRVDQWLIHRAWGVELTGKLDLPGMRPWAITVAAQSGFWQLYADHGGQPAVAARITRHAVYVLAQARPLIRVFRVSNACAGLALSFLQRAEGGWAFSVEAPLNCGNPGGHYIFMPPQQQLRNRYFHTAAGIRQFLAASTTVDLFLAPIAGHNCETLTVAAISPMQPQEHTYVFRLGNDGQPRSIHLGTHIGVRFHFLTRRGQHFHKPPWPSYRAVVVKGGNAAVLNAWMAQISHIILALERSTVAESKTDGAKAAKPKPARPSQRR